jgi:hypothetical protein
MAAKRDAVRDPTKASQAATQHGRAPAIDVNETGLTLCSAADQQLTLSEKLAVFNRTVHGGEVMVSPLVGAELL